MRPVLHRASLVEMCCGEPICLSFGPSNSKCATHLLVGARDSEEVCKLRLCHPMTWHLQDSALLL